MRIKKTAPLTIIGLVIALAFQNPAFAVIDGPCVNCHTMHNSQDGTSMNFDNSENPNELLLRSDCFGCHARGIAQNIDPLTGAPQVLHTDPTDLAAGNFAYITAAKARVTADQNTAGHNVIDLGAAYYETVLTSAPPGPHPDKTTDTNFTCAGRYGCHGWRGGALTSMVAIKGSHHRNIDGKCDTANYIYNSYRFLLGVKGLENTTDRWQNKDSNSHNEYFGDTTPMQYQCANCHAGMMVTWPVKPANKTISGFCGTCHSYFHFLEGIGGDNSSPFTRHPSDVVLPNSGEYSAYTAYSTEAPIARTTVSDTPSPTVAPGTDVVMCLSCHAVHATAYADILRWDYSDMIAGDSSKSGGCFNCHTQKN